MVRMFAFTYPRKSPIDVQADRVNHMSTIRWHAGWANTTLRSHTPTLFEVCMIASTQRLAVGAGSVAR